MRAGLIVLAIAASACTNDSNQSDRAQSSGTFKLANGVELPLLAGVKLQPACEVAGQRLPNDPNRVCLEYPRALAMPVEGKDVHNQYARLLRERGFTMEGGAGTQYWLRWPLQGGCFQPLNLTSAPKQKLADSDDLTGAEDYVLIMEFEPPTCDAR